MCSEEMLQCLQRIEELLASDKYEMLGPWSIGGAAGQYVQKSPVQTEAEWAVYGFAATAACQIQVSSQIAQNAISITGAASYGAAGAGEGNQLPAFVYVPTAATPFTPVTELHWQPAGNGGSVYALISGLAGGQAAFVTICWRRLLARYLPDTPRPQPHAHNLRQSFRAQRVLEAESAMTAGMVEGRYPIPGGPPYSHNPSPANPIDPAWERGPAAPPTPLEILQAKQRGYRGWDK